MTTFMPIALTRIRNDLCQRWREYLLDHYAVEVTTPILHRQPDIAPVRQFTTLHPSSCEVAYLRIAPTEYLKRLIVAGEDRIFEFSANFRDDEADNTHLPEFTSLEVMARDSSCADMEQRAGELVGVAVGVAHRYLAPDAQSGWVQAWDQRKVHRIELADELRQQYNVTQLWLEQPAMIAGLLTDLGAVVRPHATLPTLMDQLVTVLAARAGGAVLVSGFPEFLGGPAEPHPRHRGFKQRSELFIDGIEIANMSSNLTDGRALRRWHEQGVLLKSDLGIASNQLDEELLARLDGALPPSAVLGIGVERILQAVLGVSDIRTLRYA